MRKGDPQWDDERVIWAPPHPCSTGLRPRQFAAWVKRLRIEAVLFNEQRHWAGVVLARQLGLLTGAYVDYYTQDTVQLFDLYDFVVCNTHRHYSVFRHHRRCLYVPWGTDVETYRPEPRPQDRPLTFLISAGWCGGAARSASWLDRRGAGVTMRVFRRVPGDARLIVLSQVPLERCPPDWQESVASDRRIDFRVGTFDPVPYGDGDVYVYPSRLDGIGLTLPEALSAGLAAIATDCAPMNEFVRHGENGFVVPVVHFLGRPDGYYWAECVCDENALCMAMQRYVDHPALAIEHGAYARSHALQHLSWDINSRCLGSWIADLENSAGQPMDAALARAAYRQDRLTMPTPSELILMGCKRLFREILASLRRS